LRTPSRRLAAVSALALAATGVAFTATTASAGLVTHCDGHAEDVAVPNDLVVPDDATCELDGVSIDGEVRVGAGSDLVITDSTISGAVIVSDDGFFDAVDSSVGADVSNEDAYGVYLEGASVGGGYIGEGAEDAESFVYSFDSTVDDGVLASVGDVYIEASQVAGDVDTSGAAYTDVVDSTLTGTLTVADNEFGSAVCASEVDGDVSVTGSGEIQIGSGGELMVCDDVNYFGGNVTISDNVGGVDVTGNIVRGDLTGEGNDPAPTGDDNRVRGEAGGQFAELEPASPSVSLQSESTEVSPSEQAQKDREDRRDAALEDAAEAGPANL